MLWEKLTSRIRAQKNKQFDGPPHAMDEFSQFQLGKMGQDLAEKFLIQRNFKVLHRNFRPTGAAFRGEIDLIMKDQKSLVFIEVKTRFNSQKGSGAESVHHEKQRRLTLLAQYYLKKKGFIGYPCRFDVVTVNLETAPPAIRWYPNAFEMVG